MLNNFVQKLGRPKGEKFVNTTPDQGVNQVEIGSGIIQPQLGRANTNNNLLVDDDFFHITCHVEPGMKEKIEKGEYVDLEKLLPREGTRKLGSDM